MNLFKLSLHRIGVKPLNNFLNILLLALGTGLIAFLLLVSTQFEKHLSNNAKDIDLVVGAKGSPLQLILSGIFHIDVPTGNIPLQQYYNLKQNRAVKKVIPLALGDNFRNFRIVGTDLAYPQHYEAQLKEGNWFGKELEVVIGAKVSYKAGLKLGDAFAGAHGLDDDGEPHADTQYKVVGIMQPNSSVLDNLVLTSIESVWHTHGIEHEHGEHHAEEGNVVSVAGQEITLMLIQYRSPMAAMALPGFINRQTQMQAASPAFEMARLFSIVGVGVDTITIFAYLIIFIAALSVFVALYNALKERKYDLAIMRTLGATRFQLFSQILLEGLLLALIGSVLGIILAHTGLLFMEKLISESEQMDISASVFLKEELWIIGLACIIGMIAALLPAIQAYRTDISKVLAKN